MTERDRAERPREPLPVAVPIPESPPLVGNMMPPLSVESTWQPSNGIPRPDVSSLTHSNRIRTLATVGIVAALAAVGGYAVGSRGTNVLPTNADSPNDELAAAVREWKMLERENRGLFGAAIAVASAKIVMEQKRAAGQLPDIDSANRTFSQLIDASKWDEERAPRVTKLREVAAARARRAIAAGGTLPPGQAVPLELLATPVPEQAQK